MISQLHERLEHLVNYSSQLIFVSGDTIAQQHRNLDAFLAHQEEHTEIAYLQLDSHMEDTDVRRHLCRQLVDTDIGTFVRPFNELLHSLNQYDGPVLICITQAQLMSDKVLHELWDLVLQSRFANNKAHLNVILFAETLWAETAQQYLPARNSKQPMLLANESFSSLSDNPPGSELERLIAAKRADFAQRMQERSSSGLAPDNALRAPWFIALMLGLFCALFFSVMTSQYPDQFARFSKIFEPIEPVVSTTPIAANKTITAHKPIATIEMVSQIEQSVTPDANVPGLVMNWPASQAEPTELISTNSPGQLEVSTPVPATPVISTKSVLLDIPSNRYAVQLGAMSNSDTINDFIITHALQEQSWVYLTQRYGGDWYVVLLNNDYSTIQEARRAVNSLPPEVQALTPFVKPLSVIKKEILISDD